MRQTEMDEDGDGDIEFLMDEWIYRDKQEQITEYELQSYREGFSNTAHEGLYL